MRDRVVLGQTAINYIVRHARTKSFHARTYYYVLNLHSQECGVVSWYFRKKLKSFKLKDVDASYILNKLHRMPSLEASSRRITTLNLRLTRSIDDRSIDRKRVVRTVTLKNSSVPTLRLPVFGMHSRYFESASLPFGPWYPFVSRLDFKFYGYVDPL